MSIRLDFLAEKKKDIEFGLSEEMVKILKSDLKADRAALIVSSGYTFKKLARLVSVYRSGCPLFTGYRLEVMVPTKGFSPGYRPENTKCSWATYL